MILIHSHTFTADEAATLRAAIEGIRIERRTKAGQERYELSDDEVKELKAIGTIRAGDEIELDRVTWIWLAVLLDTWMSDAPLRLHGAIFALSGMIQELTATEPERVIPYQRETRSQAVPVAESAVPTGCLF